MAANTQRLFFSLWPDDRVRRQISAATQDAVAAADGRVISPDNYHITLAFLGGVPRDQVAALIAAARTVRFPAFSLELDGMGNLARSLVVLSNADCCPVQLVKLVDDLWAVLEPFGLVPDSRAFKPHVSLVRSVSAGSGSQLPEPIIWPADEFVLISSETLSTGSAYTLLEHFPAGV